MRLRPIRLRWVLLCLVMALLTMLINHHQGEPDPSNPAPNPPSQTAHAPTSTAVEWTSLVTKPGDQLITLLRPYGFTINDIHQIIRQAQPWVRLSPLRAQQILLLTTHTSRATPALKIPLANNRALLLTFDHHTLHHSVIENAFVSQITLQHATVDQSLSHALSNMNLTNAQAVQFAHIFSGVLRLDRDIRKNDQLSAIIQTYYQDNTALNRGTIVAAQIRHKQHQYQAFYFRHGDTGNYYAATGQSIEPLFLSAPLHYTRISSTFQKHRLDPYTHTIRPHLGIDYAAHHGTPIKSIGNGVIISKGKRGGYGNAIIIKYPEHYTAIYGHMSRFSPKLQVGSFVKRGQTIGYVGSTGWSTGPHLHFGLYRYNKALDPLHQHFIGGVDLPANQRSTFVKQTAELQQLLKQADDE